MVVADTGPINYLLLIEHIEILLALFEKVILPSMVRDELARPKAPVLVRDWIANVPAWVEVHPASAAGDVSLERLDAGEGAAIILAVELDADMLLMDDREGVIAALRKGFRVAGTLGVLSMASRRGHVEPESASVQIWGISAAIPMLLDDQVDEQTQAILDERLKTIDSDAKTARPWRKVLAETQAKLRHPAPQ